MFAILPPANRILVNIITKNPAPSNDFNSSQLIDVCQLINQLPITTTLRITQSPHTTPHNVHTPT